jgi:CheY-like chemotaxis protein
MSKANSSYELVVLVVEDEFLIRDSIVDYLRRAGCLVLEAPSGEQALALLHEDQPIDVVFTDIRLGGELTGHDVGRTCRAMWPDVAVVYTSGHALEPARTVPGSRFFAKPYQPDQILHACRELRQPAR